MVNIAVNSADLKFREYVQKCQINLVSTLATSCQEIYTISYIWTIVAFEKHKSSSIMFIVIPPLKMCLCVLGSCCAVRYDFHIKTMFNSFESTVVCWRAHAFIYVIRVCLRIVVSSAYCVVFLLWLSSSCVPCAASFSGFSSFDSPFGIF